MGKLLSLEKESQSLSNEIRKDEQRIRKQVTQQEKYIENFEGEVETEGLKMQVKLSSTNDKVEKHLEVCWENLML